MNQILSFLTKHDTHLIYILILLFILKYFLNSKPKNHHSNWNTLIDNFKFSSKEFYKLLKEDISKNKITGIRTSHVYLNEGNFFSSKRIYMRVEWKEFQYDICASPFGNGFFISWWLLYKKSFIQKFIHNTPFLGEWLMNKLFPETYYKIDTASMFMSYIHQSVLNVLNTISINHGTRLLTENEKKPILKNVFKR